MITKTKRGKRNSAKRVIKSLVMTGFNPDGYKSKVTTIKKLIREMKASVITMQETKCQQTGQIKLDGYFTYEHLRSNELGGGIAISALEELCPTFVSDGGEEVEALTICIKLRNMSIWITSAYGPQETAQNVKKTAFWKYISEQAQEARACGQGFVLQGDLNSWLGSNELPGDLRDQNKNGKLFQTFLEQNNLICVNSLPFTKGLITRSRKYLGKVKQSTIDFYVVCESVLPYVSKMEILNDNSHMLTNFSAVNNNGEPVNSDHAPLKMEIEMDVAPVKKTKIEIMNFNDKESQMKFKEITSQTNVFTKCFETLQPVLEQSNTWLSHVSTHCKKAFKNIRIRPRKIKPSAADRLIGQRNRLLKEKKTDEAKELDNKIAKAIAEEGRKKSNMFQKYCDKNESGVLSEMWKMKKSLFPKKASTLPSSKINYQGKLVTEPTELTKLLGEEYGRVRLRQRPTHPKHLKLKNTRRKLIKLKMEIAMKRKTAPFQMNELECVLKSLKPKKARGPEGLSRTLFNNSVIGSNLKDSLLIMFNKLKQTGKIPHFMKKAVVTTIPKKGSKIKLENERGIFIVNCVRGIFMRLLYNLKRHILDDHMSDSNVGGRRNKSGINHIWAMNCIIHDQISSVKKTPAVIQQWDYKQMFDGMDDSEACGDIFTYGVNDDHLTLIHEANREVAVSVKTPYGLSKEYKLTGRTMQGDTWASAKASAQVDFFGKEMVQEQPNFMYKFKGEVPIPLLGQVDDLVGVSEAGFKAEQLSAFVNVKTADKDLQFGPAKCKYMIISKVKHQSFHKPQLTVDTWKLKHTKSGNMIEEFQGKVELKEEESLMYLGYMLSNKGSNMPNIIHKRNKSIGTQKQIPRLIEKLGPYRFESAMIYIEALLRSSILYGSETMHNVKEFEWRAIESTEESVIQRVAGTLKSCGRHLLYLENGFVPARFQVQRQMLNRLQYILQQPEGSLLPRMYEAQRKFPTKGDWASETALIVEKHEINLTNCQIRCMKENTFKALTKRQSRKRAFKYLITKLQGGSKGSSIRYNTLEMADYLLPECELTVEEKISMFSIRCEMNDLPFNFGTKQDCQLGCSEPMNTEHILLCSQLNENAHDLKFDNILNGTLRQKIEVFHKIELNTKKRSELLTK